VGILFLTVELQSGLSGVDARVMGLLRAPERIRTSDLWYRKPALYPLSYGGRGESKAISLGAVLLFGEEAVELVRDAGDVIGAGHFGARDGVPKPVSREDLQNAAAGHRAKITRLRADLDRGE